MVSRAKSTKKKAINSKKENLVSVDENLSEEESKIIDESFGVISKLNSQIDDIEKAKDVLQKDVGLLSKRLDNHDSKTVSSNKLLLSIKEEIIKDFAPLLNKMNFKGIKVDVFKEVSNLVELEIEKLRSEFSSENLKSNKELKKIISDLEIRLVDSLRNYSNLKEELKDFDSKKILNLISELEERVDIKLKEKVTSLNTVSEKDELDLNNVLEQIENYKSQVNDALEEFNKSKLVLDENLKGEGINLSSIESRIDKFANDLESMRSLVSKYEDDLYSRENNESLEIEKKVNDTLAQTNSLLTDFSKVKEAHEIFLADKLNEIIDSSNKFEDRLVDLEKKDIKRFKEEFSKNIDNYVEKFSNNFSKKCSTELFQIKEEVEKEYLSIKDESSKMFSSLGEFMSKAKLEFKEYLNTVHQEVENLRLAQEGDINELNKKFQIQVDEFLKFEKTSQSLEKFIEEKYNESVSKIDEFTSKIISDQNILKKDVSLKNSEEFENLVKILKEDISREVLSLKEFMTRSSTQMTTAQRDLSELIENKFLSLRDNYDSEFRKKSLEFDKEISDKENLFLDRLNVIDKEKNELFDELGKFKNDVAVMTKNYSNEIDLEIQNLKTEKTDFESKRQEFLDHLDSVSHVKLTKISEETEMQEMKLRGIVDDFKSSFLSQDDLFKNSFNEKISGIREGFNLRLDSIEKKFVEKNLKIVKEKFDEELKELLKIEDKLIVRADQIENKIKFNEQKELEFFENLHSENELLQEKVEVRLTTLEKQLNKRFLELDTEFSSFKSIVIDEVESLIKDIDTIMSSKLESVDNMESKLKFMLTQGAKEFKAYAGLKDQVEKEVKLVRDEVNDLRVKVDVMNPELQVSSMNNLVSTMSEYESHLVALVQNLRKSGVSDNHILEILVSKGHPKFYASVLLKLETRI